jgi:integrase
MKAIFSYEESSLQTCIALKFSALTFCRPGEIRHAEWSELDLENNLWRIPAEKMKMGQPHLVPLATQTIELLQQLRPMTSYSRYLFPSLRSADRPMSEATILVALRSMGFDKDEMVPHGFRGMASSLLNEQGFNRDWKERQLAHGEGDKVRAAYNHTDYLAGRRKMMQEWADFLYKLAEE